MTTHSTAPLTILWLVSALQNSAVQGWTSSLASSRYRGIIPAQYLAKFGHEVVLMSPQDWLAERTGTRADILVVGKMMPDGDEATSRIFFKQYLDALQEARLAKQLVIADFCDDHFGHPLLGPAWQRLAALADRCCTSTAALQARVRQYSAGPVEVVGDPIASPACAPHVYQPPASPALNWRTALRAALPWPAKPRDTGPLQILWFGSLTNWAPLQRWVKELVALRPQQALHFRLVTSTHKVVTSFCHELKLQHGPQVTAEHIVWDESRLWQEMAQCDLVILPSDPDANNKQIKSANRLTDALHMGCHVIASPLPAYEPYGEAATLTDEPLQAVRAYLQQPAAVLERIRRGADLARTLADPEVIAAQWQAVFSRAMAQPQQRILFVAMSNLPTLQLRFQWPLAEPVEHGDMTTRLLSEQNLGRCFGPQEVAGKAATAWVTREFEHFAPTLLVFCRYSGPHAQHLLALSQRYGVPSLMHIDDDLLDVPLEIGRMKYEFHRQEQRRHSLRELLTSVDLVQTANTTLIERFSAQGIHNHSTALTVPCPHFLMETAPAQDAGSELRIGYMGIDHAADLALVVDVLVHILDQHPETVFELMGPMPLPQSLEQFGLRVRQFGPQTDYPQFLRQLAARRWHIGICPLVKSAFNDVKTHIKWVEYSSVGAAVIASAGSIYDECCAQGRGLLARTAQDWQQGLTQLVQDHTLRQQQVAIAQAQLRSRYGVPAFRDELFEAFNQARQRHARRSGNGSPDSSLQ